MIEKNPENKSKIRFSDCDPFNHLNNSKYIDYFLNAREDQLLLSYQLDIAKLAREKGLGWFVTQNQIAYVKPATVMETVVIQSSLRYFDQKELLVEEIMWNEEKTVLKSVLWTKYIHFNLMAKKTETHSDELLSLFKEIVIPVPEGMNFEERVTQLSKLSNGK